MDGGMVEAGAMFATLMGLIKVIEKLVESKVSKPQPSVQVDLKQEGLGEIIETQNAISQAIERCVDKLDEIDRRTRETGSTIFEVRENQRIQIAKAEVISAMRRSGDNPG